MFLSVLFTLLFSSVVQQTTAEATLQLQLQTVPTTGSDQPEFELTLKNVSQQDTSVNLGYVLANGKFQIPANIVLDFSDGNGRARRFQFADLKHSAIAGRVDDYIVPLRAGSTYSIRFTLDQFWCQETSEFEINLTNGRNQLTAELEGTGAKHVNLDMPAVKLIHFWLGTARSNTLFIEK